MADKLDKRVAVVTGASRGIGEAISKSLANQGRHVVLVARTEDALNKVKSDIEADGGSASVKTCDFTDHEAVAGLMEEVADEFGRLDILVNNAGITRDGLLLRMSDEDWDDVINTNLRSVFVAVRAAARPMMRGKWGRIINIASVSGLVGNAGQANYAAAKSGLLGFTKTVAKELSGKQITANVVAPGFIETAMTDVLPDQVKEVAKSHTPLKRFGQPQEIAAAVAYFASEDASYTTGQTLAVDGGMTMI